MQTLFPVTFAIMKILTFVDWYIVFATSNRRS